MSEIIKAVIFDLDGTLVNTLDDIAAAMNYSLALHGLPVWDVDDYRYLVGNGARVLAKRAVRDRQDMLDQVHRAYQHQYETHSRVLSAPYPGIPQLLDELRARGIPCSVFSNKPDADTAGVISHYFPGYPFSVVRGQLDTVPLKPDPAGALAIAGSLGIPPANFAYLGDTGTDMTCAAAAGMQAFGVLWGFRGREELIETGARFLLDSPEDLVAYL